MNKKLIITADDYGLSPSVNRAIEECVQKGTITSTNVMMNMDFVEQGVGLKNRFPGLSLGIHFVLTAGKSLLDAALVKTLVDENGIFHSLKEFRRRYQEGLLSKEEMALELTAQAERFTSLYGPPNYWNSHEHVHLDFGLYDFMIAQTLRLGIQKSRCNRKIYAGSLVGSSRSLKWLVKSKIKNQLLNIYYRRKKLQGLPDGMITFINEQDAFDQGLIFSKIKWGRYGCGELVIHPATSNDSPFFGYLVEKRLREYAFFNDSSLKETARKNGIELIGFDAI